MFLDLSMLLTIFLSILQILLLDDGKVAEFDAPQTLLADPNSRFAKLAATQGIFHSSRSPVVAQDETGDVGEKNET